MAVNDALKLAFSRPRPDSVFHAARIFSASVPSGHASLSAIAYVTIGAFLARSQPSVTISVYRHGARGDSDRVDRDEPRLSRGSLPH
jgi:undecaprenyl-diphosphatase